MTPPLEARDYIGLGAAAASSSCSSSSSSSGEAAGPHLALRLGLPGSDSPGRRADAEHVDAALTLGPAPAPPRGGAKRGFADSVDRSAKRDAATDDDAGGVRGEEKGMAEAAAGAPRDAKAQVVGWPPVRSYRKNMLAASATKTKGEDEGRNEAGCCYVKVSMDGAPYLRKVDLKTYSSYEDLSLGLEKMFSCFITGKSSPCKPSRRKMLTDGSRADALQDQEYVLTYEDKEADWMLVGDLPWDLFTTSCRKLRIMRGSDAAGMAPRSLEQTGRNK
ncbi:auxin-responsive protein IAA19-like isoform X2 [Phragmites australis]|uniref:auxin-responsive protein IAA19-like isoform X2 n=1 Tax=Phragmites australis TaxID=29695 RepID=UPI002D7694A2|nr:auxin-responsive protein IAA19-like isoform X2 [Phragmites australis]